MYLFTADGTRYALTFNNAQSLVDFFYNPILEGFDKTRADEYYRVAKKYYLYDEDEPNHVPKIQETNTDTNQDLVYFMNFIKDANLSVTVFEMSNDLNTFTRVTLNNSGAALNRDNCN